jgi:putative toxin-antitoxin system antitoxin component (TIGR02293 family)
MTREMGHSMIEEGIVDRVFARAEEVLGSREYARAWLMGPSYAFGARRPVDLLCSTSGAQEVLDELGRLQHGIPA